MFANKIAFVVPTRDRPREVGRLLNSIMGQGYHPEQIIVVNGGSPELKSTLAEFPGLPIDYLEVQPPALTRQKNAGVRAADPSMDLIACVDDDIVFAEGSIEAMMGFWETAGPEVGGASFNLTIPRPATSWVRRLFFIDNREFGRVLSSGHNTPNTSAETTRRSQWLIGGATVWRRDVFRDHSFDEWFLGSGTAEDLTFSYAVGKRYALYVVAEARVQHLEPKRNWRSSFRAGHAQVVNRVYFVRRNPDLSLARCSWNLIGRLLGNLAGGAVKLDPCLIMRACGNVVGLAQVATGHLGRVEVRTFAPRKPA